MNKIANNLKLLMIKQKLSVSELSILADVKISTIYNLKYQRSTNPTINTLKPIAKALDCTVSEIIGDKNYYYRNGRTSKKLKNNC